jgi:hypothetical protein
MPQIIVSQGQLGSFIEQPELAEEIRYGIVPVGSVLPFLKNLTNTPSLPTGWVECNGQTISDSDSVYNGVTLPDLNGDNRFLRGDSTSGNTGGSETHSHTMTFAYGSYDPGTDYYADEEVLTTSTEDSKPPYYGVVWIMRIK